MEVSCRWLVDCVFFVSLWKTGNVMFYLIVLIVLVFSCTYSLIVFFKDIKHSLKDSADFIRKILIDIFVIVFCLSKIFPDIAWL